MNQIMAYLANQKIINPSTPWCSTISIMLLLLTSSNTLLAQNGELPPVSFPSGKNVCDNSPWQLVLYDEFNGTSLDTSTWITFNSWAGMSPKDHENWREGRIALPYIAIMKDQNVVVNNGSVKLQVKKEPTTWKCDTCAVTRHTDYSCATLAIPYTNRSFDAGRFEAKIKFPIFPNAHSTFWTWKGNDVDEIDIAEAYGPTKLRPRSLNTNNVHAFYEGTYKLPDSWDQADFPGQAWWDKYSYHQQDYHIYGCDWDTALVTFFLDNSEVRKVWKYYQERNYQTGHWFWTKTWYYKVGSSCFPSSGVWRITPGFPWNNHSSSNLRFDCSLDSAITDPGWGTGLLGEMEIDYVKMWQRHLQSGWQNICLPATPTISGPDIVCGTATYTISSPTPNGYWVTPLSPNLHVLSSSANSITVQAVPGTGLYQASITYNAADNNCAIGTNYIIKKVDVGLSSENSVICTRATSSSISGDSYCLGVWPSRFGFACFGSKFNSPTTFEWDVYYGPSGLLHYHSFGQFISTPAVSFYSGILNTVQWQVKITNACGTVTKTGTMNFHARFRVTSPTTDHDTNNVYAIADITDFSAYDSAVTQRIRRTFLPDDADTTSIMSAIQQVALEELAPYIIRDSVENTPINTERRTSGATNSPTVDAATVVYPNPTSSNIIIALSGKYCTNEAVEIRLFDMMGVLQLEKDFSGSKKQLSLNITSLPVGLYRLSISQSGIKEQLSITKQ